MQNETNFLPFRPPSSGWRKAVFTALVSAVVFTCKEPLILSKTLCV